MKQLKTLDELLEAAKNHKSVVAPDMPPWNKPRAAAFMLNQIGGLLHNLFRSGMYIHPVKFTAGPRGEYTEIIMPVTIQWRLPGME